MKQRGILSPSRQPPMTEWLPYRNPTYDRPYLPSGKYRYLLSAKRYRIIYQIVGNAIWVDDIQDCRHDD